MGENDVVPYPYMETFLDRANSDTILLNVVCLFFAPAAHIMVRSFSAFGIDIRSA